MALRARHDGGMVTAEFAAGIPILVVLLTIALGAISAVTTQLRCEHAAYQAVRAAARGAGTSDAASTMPEGARLQISDTGGRPENMIRATVTARVRIWGATLPAVTVVATRLAVPEQQRSSP